MKKACFLNFIYCILLFSIIFMMACKDEIVEKEKSVRITGLSSYSGKINIFVKEFIEIFCNKDGSIEWEKLVKYNSGK